MQKFFLFVLLGILVINVFAQENLITSASELNKLGEISDLAGYVGDTAVKQVSSYHTTGNNDDGFSGKYSFIRRNPDSTLVIFDEAGLKKLLIKISKKT